MYCDLNIRKNENESNFLQLLTSCIEDNYQYVAVNHCFKDLIVTQKSTFQEIPTQKLQNILQKSINMQQFSTLLQKDFKQLSRVTIDIGDIKFTRQNKDIIQTYDLVAIKPRTDRILNEIIEKLDCFDIITFDCFDKLPFVPKRSIIQELIKRGAFIEINYGDAIQDQQRRRMFISNAMILIKATQGKNIIFSSDVSNWILHRSPYDLVALGITLGLKKDVAYETIGKNPINLIQKAKHRRTFKGTVSLANEADIQYFQQKNQEKEDGQNNILKQLRKKVKISNELYLSIKNLQ